jgi:mannose-1-phosphate guanylyltransferase/mannose-1-phosphate guanylyltransferase/mannose-6-phosphate isomerase
MSRTIYPVILSGGSGTRLWPLSRDLFPKQLLSLIGPESLLTATARRVSGDGFAGPVIVCNKDHRFLVQDQLAAAGIAPEAIVIEPAARNTAPAIAAAAALIRARDPEGLLLVLPSDHIIRDLPALKAAIAAAAAAAETGCLVTFGITPTAPETGYGYIRSGDRLAGVAGAHRIAKFVEKPDLATAASYLAAGDWSWNSGMFVFPVGLLLDELASFEPDIAARAIRAVDLAGRDGAVVALDPAAFAEIPSKSIDYALMERTTHSAVVPADLGWSDIGSWSALWDIGDKDITGNIMIGDVMAEDTDGSYLRSDGPLIAALGLRDVILVATGDVILAAAKDRAQDVKRFVQRLKVDGRSESVSHRTVSRPWGAFEVLDSGAGYAVKRLTVKPGRRLSLKKHAERAEHWIVVKGTARVTLGEDLLMLTPNMSIQIPKGTLHRVENVGSDALELIEVQSGEVLSEDDFVRVSDDYGRV